MTFVIIIDKEIENLECIKEGDKDLYNDIVSILTDDDIIEEFAININDKTWEEMKNDFMKRLTLNENGLKQYLKNANYVFVYKNGKYKLCISE